MTTMIDITETTNGANSLNTSGNRFVDFFMMFVRGIDNNILENYLNECWKEDPTKTVAIIFHARDRANGKKEKTISNRAMIWLRNKKYSTYTKNLYNYVIKYGSWKDITYITLKRRYCEFEYDLFVSQLKKDKEFLINGNKKDISLCAKWVSSEKDRINIINRNAYHIASRLFPDDPKMYEKYRKEYITPLRKALDIVETYMSSNRWTEIKYENVPAVATKRLKKTFEKHDPEGYNNYLSKVAKGEKKINVTGILPHELVKYYIDGNVYNETIEQQWNTIVDNIKNQGILNNIVAIVDVSGSMISGKNVRPIEPAIALGILIAECNNGRFNNKIISFDSRPDLYHIKGNSLLEKINDIKENMNAGTSTNFEATIDLILHIGKMFNVSPDNMPDKVIVLSDMQFNEASDTSIKEDTMHDYIIKKYNNTSYKPPKFIYWNLSSSNDNTFPVKAITENVAMISGFSEQLLKVFMNTDKFDADSIVNEILSKYIPDIVIDENDYYILDDELQ